MGKRRRDPDSDGTTTDSAAYNTVFVDTSFNTHLAIISAGSDTVFELKDKIVLEHGRCFPEIGEIKIHALKVKRKGFFYHLPDYMVVKSAFEGATRGWFLYVDVAKCTDATQIMKYGATNQRALLTANLHDQDHLLDDCFKMPSEVHKVEVAECNIPESTPVFKDDNVPNDVGNLDSYSSSQSVETCNSAKRLKRKHNSLLATSASKDINMTPQALHSSKLHLETEDTTVNTQINKAGKLLGSHVASQPQRDGQETSSSNIKTSKMDHMDKTVQTNLLALDDPELNRTGELNPSQDGIKEPGESTLPSTLSDTKEVNEHRKRKKKTHESSKKNISKISRSGIEDGQVGRSTANFGLFLPNVAASDHQFSQSTVEKGIFSSKADAIAVEQNLLTKIVDTDEATEAVNHGDMKKRKGKKPGAAVKDQQNRETIVAENDLNLKQVPETKLSSSPEVNEATEDGKDVGEKKKKQEVEKAVARVQETVDMNRDADQINDIVSPSLDSPDPGEGMNRRGKKSKRVKKSGAAAKDQHNGEIIVAKNDLNLKQVPQTELPSYPECPDVLDASEVNEATDNGKATGEKKRKQKMEKAVARVQETVDVNPDVDHINDIVSPSLDIPDPGDLVPPRENNEISQKIEERDLLGTNNLVEMVLPRVGSSYRDQNEPVIETVSNTNRSTAIVADEPKMTGTGMKRRARKTVSGVQDGMNTENTQTDARPSSSQANWHADLQVEKDRNLLPGHKEIEASARKASDTSRGKNTLPMESPPNEVPAELKSQKDGEVSECIRKDINFKQYFVPSHHQDEVTRGPSAGTVATEKKEEVVPSAPKLQQDLPKSYEKDSVVSSAGKANTLTESNRTTQPKKKIGKRGVPYATTSSDLDDIRTPQKPVSSFLNGSDATKTVPRKKEIVNSLTASGINASSKKYEKLPLKSNTQDRKESSLRHHVTTGKNTSSKLDGQVVNKTKQQKSLGHTPKAIFRDVSSGSSLDENGSVDSSASTRSPSDNLSSSNDLSEDALGKGRDDKDRGGSKKSVSNSEISSPRHIPIENILKSSSRFKKAKLTASQQFEDPDSQLGEFLPETQHFP